MTMNLSGKYDVKARPAKTLRKAKKKPVGHRLNKKDFAELKNQADAVSRQIEGGEEAELVSYHKRRKRSRWRVGDMIYEVVVRLGLIVITLLKVLIP